MLLINMRPDPDKRNSTEKASQNLTSCASTTKAAPHPPCTKQPNHRPTPMALTLGTEYVEESIQADMPEPALHQRNKHIAVTEINMPRCIECKNLWLSTDGQNDETLKLLDAPCCGLQCTSRSQGCIMLAAPCFETGRSTAVPLTLHRPDRLRGNHHLYPPRDEQSPSSCTVLTLKS